MNQSIEKKNPEISSIVINLKESSDATIFNERDSNFIHYREFRRVQEMISRRLEFLSSETVDMKRGSKFVKERYHDTITVFGTRGSGKTSFLLNLLETLDSNRDVMVLPIIDPTLIEEKGHVFLNVISLIEQKVTEKLDADSLNPENKDYLDSVRWRRMVEALAHGLPSIDGIGGNMTDTQWQDPEFIMDNGIRSVISARELEGNFNKIVEEGLKILGKKAFLVVFDDIDIDFRKGWQVLETIRKYLTSPRIITVLSGDFRLLSLAIRKHQWENLGDKFKESEVAKNDKLGYYNELVTEMESQYLQKVLKPERRIHLSTLKEKLQLLGDNKYGIFVDAKPETISIKEFYKKILKEYGVNNSYQAESYSSFLLSLPLRTQIRFLCLFEDIESTMGTARVTDIFLSELYEKQVDVNLLNSLPKYLNAEILKLLLSEHTLAEAYQLQPITTDDTLNSCLIALSFSFGQGVVNKQPQLIFDYFIRIGYTRNLG